MSKLVGGYGGKGGMSKHRKSGRTTKSPKVRMRMELEARKNERKAPKPLPYDKVEDLFDEV